MDIALKKILILKKFEATKEKKKQKEYENALIENINTVKFQLESVESRYNILSDDNLIEALIFEENALKAKYDYLIGVAKSRNVQSDKIF